MNEGIGQQNIILGDSLTWLARLPAQSVDLVFADPPYNLQLRKTLFRPNYSAVEAVDAEWDQFEGFDDYDAFSRAWLAQVRRVMKPTGSIWICGTYHNIFRVGAILQDFGFWVLNTVVWHKPNAMPNFRGTRLRNDVEWVVWAKYDETSRYIFNHHLMKRFNDGKQLGSVWEINRCGGPERLRDGQGKTLHPTQKPEALLRRIILASTQPGDLVLDPFVGTGTTAVVAKQLHRRWLGIENNPVYVRAARGRVYLTQPGPLDATPPPDPRPKRVAFKLLLKEGYLDVGQTLYFKDPACEAVIIPGGKLRLNDTIDTIHGMGRRLRESGTCNGWKHWYFLDDITGQRQLIDVLRDRYRARQRG